MSFGDDLERQIMNAAREQAREHVLDVCRDIQHEMGDEAAGVTFDYVTASGSGEELGELVINGPDGVKERFAQKVRERMGQ